MGDFCPLLLRRMVGNQSRLGRVIIHGQRITFILSIFMEGSMKRLSGLLALTAFLAVSMTAPLSFASDDKKEEKKGGH